MTAKQISTMIASFLKSRIKIEPGYERAKADPKDVERLEQIVGALVEAKWEPSYDGFLPIEVILNNRSTHQPLNYHALPYIKDDESVDEYQTNFKHRMDLAELNLSAASEEVRRTWYTQRLAMTITQAKKEGRYCRIHGDYLRPGKCPRCDLEKGERK